MVPVLITNDIITGLAYSSWLSSWLAGGTGNATIFSDSTTSSFMPAAPRTQSSFWTMKMLRSTVPKSRSLPLFPYKCNILALPDFVCSVDQNTTLMPGTVLKMKFMSLLTGKGVWTVVRKPIPPWGKHTCRTLMPCPHHYPAEHKRWPWGCLPYWMRGRVPATLTGLCKAMWPSASRLNPFQILSLFTKGTNNPCPTHITGHLGRSNKTYLEALFKS